MGVSINLGRRFGLVGPDLTKARKKKPDSGLDWRGYNAANPTETQKDSLGRWVGGVRDAFAELKTSGNQWVGLADLREKLEARGITREQQDAAFMDMLRHDSDVRIIPVANSKALKPRDREAALSLGVDNQLHAMSISDENRQWQPKTPRSEAMDPSPLSPSAEPWKAARTRLLEQMQEVAGSDLADWTDEDLLKLKGRANTIASGVTTELARRANAAKMKREAANISGSKPRASARVKAKAEPDYEHMVAQMRALPVLPESDTAVRRALDPLTIPELKALAGTAGVPLSSKMRKQDIRDAIHMQLIGSRISTDSVMHYDDPGRFDRRRAEAAAKATPQKPMQDQVRDAYGELQRYPGDWVPLADLRDKLGGDRADVDEALKAMATQPGVHIIPWDNRKALRQRDHDASLRFGGDDNHAIRIEPPTSAGLTGTPSWIKPSTEPVERRRSMADDLRGTAKVTARPRTNRPGTSRTAAYEAPLSRLPKPKLQEVAARLGVPSASKTKAQLIESITAATIGAPGTLRRALGDFDVPGDGATTKPRADVPSSVEALRPLVNDPPASAREDVDKILASLTSKQLDEVAAKFGVTVGPTTNVAQKRGRLRETLVGGKLDSAAIARGTSSWRDEVGSGGGGGDASSSLRHAEAQLEEMRADLENLYGSDDPDRWPEARQDRQVEAYWDQRERVERMRQQSSTKATPEAVRAAYAELASERGEDLVSLVRLRDRLKDVPREDLDRVLKEMDRARVIQLEPDPNRKALPQESRDAAIVLGGDPKHFIFFRGGGGTQAAEPAAPSTPRSLPRSGHRWNWETIQEDNSTMHGDSASMELAQALHRAGREDDAQYVADMRYRISNNFGEHSPDDVERMVADLKAMMDRESDPKLRARYQRALEDIDAPAKSLPALPDSTPPVLRRMVDELNRVPNARRTGRFAGTNKDVAVVDRLADVIRRVDAGDREALRGWQMQMRDALNSLHESVDGAYQMWRLEKLLDDPEIRSWVRSHYPT